MVFFGFFPKFFISVMIGVLFEVLVEFGLVVGDVPLIEEFLFEEMFGFGFNFIDEIFLLANKLFICFFQVVNSVSEEFVLF